jgi:hypothetical protein
MMRDVSIIRFRLIPGQLGGASILAMDRLII